MSPTCSLLLAGCLASAQEDGNGGDAQAAIPYSSLPAGSSDAGDAAPGAVGNGDAETSTRRRPPIDSGPDSCYLLPGSGAVCGSNGRSYSSPRAACRGGTQPQCKKRCPCAPPTNPEDPPPFEPSLSCPGCATVRCSGVVEPLCCRGRSFRNSCFAGCCGFDVARQCRPGSCRR
jgi:hypothetical protein